MSRRLIINADDLGYDPAVTRGILKAMREGVVSSATLMINTPFSQEAARAAAGLSVGLHFNLARNAPVSGAIRTALLERGEFVEARAGQLSIDEVEAEANAQLDRLQAWVGRPATHVDVHKHLHRHPAVLEGLIRAAGDRNLPVRAIDEAMRQTLRASQISTPDHFIGGADQTAYWTLSQFREEVPTLLAGVTELMCHPGYAPTEVRSGYSTQREVELATFVHPDARALLERLDIQVVDFGAVER